MWLYAFLDTIPEEWKWILLIILGVCLVCVLSHIVNVKCLLYIPMKVCSLCGRCCAS
jgi:hypothetical protein